MFGQKRSKKYDGKPAAKLIGFERCTRHCLDPHGTGKVLKPATILARSSEGNVRVRDVVEYMRQTAEMASVN